MSKIFLFSDVFLWMKDKGFETKDGRNCLLGNQLLPSHSI